MKELIIKDRPCGSGKTSDLLRSFDPEEKYLVVVPLLKEVDRVLSDACVKFYEPIVSEKFTTKYEHVLSLILDGLNIVITHQLYKDLAKESCLGILSDYNIIIDEVPDTIEVVSKPSHSSFEKFYIQAGMVTIDGFGKVQVTEAWQKKRAAFNDTLDANIFSAATKGTLMCTEERLLLKVLPKKLFTLGRSITVLTFLSEGSYFPYYLKKMGIKYVVDIDQTMNRRFKEKMTALLNLHQIPGYRSGDFSFSKQSAGIKDKTYYSKVSSSLKNLTSRYLKGVDRENVILTCMKQGWIDNNKPGVFQKGSKLTKAHWIANTTRGTNEYAHCSHAIYLYNQNINPTISRWLGLNKAFNDAYALTELIQWLYRTRIRKGLSVTLFLSDPRMMKIVKNWIDDEIVWAA